MGADAGTVTLIATGKVTTRSRPSRLKIRWSATSTVTYRSPTVPVTRVGQDVIVGYDQAALEHHFGAVPEEP